MSAYGVRTILVSLRSLLTEPNNESFLNVQAAGMWANQAAFKQMVVATFTRRARGFEELSGGTLFENS